jgi:hypothetical protein
LLGKAQTIVARSVGGITTRDYFNLKMMGRRWTHRVELILAIGLPVLALLLYAIGYLVRLIKN